MQEIIRENKRIRTQEGKEHNTLILTALGSQGRARPFSVSLEFEKGERVVKALYKNE